MIWTPEEDAILCEEYPHRTQSEMAELFPGRDADDIRYRARAMGIKKLPETLARSRCEIAGAWSAEEEELLRQRWTTAPLHKVYASFKRTRASLQEKARNLGLYRPAEEIQKERVKSALKGAGVVRGVTKQDRILARVLKHPIEAAWRGM